MKKDQKFLNNLEENLGHLNKKDKSEILLKYRKIIDSEKESGKRIVDIIKSLGDVKELASKEIDALKNNNKFDNIKKKIKSMFSISKKEKKIKVKKDKKDKVKKVKESKINHKKNNSKSQRTKLIRKSKYCFKKFFNKFKFKKRSKLDNHIDDIKEEFSESIEIVPEKKLFESKSKRVFRIVLRTFGIILIIVLLFTWLWTVTVFIASLFAVLDGIKFYGINIGLLGLMLVNLWLLIIMNKIVFGKKIHFWVSLISILLFFAFIGCGIAYTINQIATIKTIKDVSDKYSMVRSYETYSLPSKEEKNLYIIFNSNYDTQYTVDYDEKLDGKIKLEVKYYEAYYDFYVKRSSNNIYVSLKTDYRDRLSVYINDLKDNKVYDKDELSRYSVRIIGSKKDLERVIIEN